LLDHANIAQHYLQPDRTSVVDVDHPERGSVVTLPWGEAMKEIANGYVVIIYIWA
jgi:hypothetical protein